MQEVKNDQKVYRIMPSDFLIIFDLDGTLVDSDINYSLMKAKLKHLISTIVPYNKFQDFISNPRSILEMVEFIRENDETGEVFKQAWDIIEYYEELGYETATIKPDVIPTLQKIKEMGYKIAILTNNSRKLTKHALEKFGLRQYVDAIITRDDIKNSKPHPEGINKLMKLFNVKPEKTLFIGDSWLDREAALNANVRFLYFGHAGAPSTREKNYTDVPVINTIEEILKTVHTNTSLHVQKKER